MLIMGAGGAGMQIVQDKCLDGAGERVAMNTDLQALVKAEGLEKMQVGTRTCAGKPAGTPMVGDRAVRESIHMLEARILRASTPVVVVAGLGGSTGTALVTAIASLCVRHVIQFRAVVTVPPEFSTQARAVALRALADLRAHGHDVYVYDLQAPLSATDRALPEVLLDARNDLVAQVLAACGRSA